MFLGCGGFESWVPQNLTSNGPCEHARRLLDLGKPVLPTTTVFFNRAELLQQLMTIYCEGAGTRGPGKRPCTVCSTSLPLAQIPSPAPRSLVLPEPCCAASFGGRGHGDGQHLVSSPGSRLGRATAGPTRQLPPKHWRAVLQQAPLGHNLHLINVRKAQRFLSAYLGGRVSPVNDTRRT